MLRSLLQLVIEHLAKLISPILTYLYDHRRLPPLSIPRATLQVQWRQHQMLKRP